MKTSSLTAGGLLLSAVIVSAVPLTLTNTDFSGGISSGNNPAGWVTTEALAGNLGIQTSTIAANGVVLTFQGRNSVNNIQQDFLTAEVTADTYGSFTVQFEAGWRNNTAAPNDMGWTVSIINVTDGGVLGSATYTLPPNSPTNQFDVYRTLGTQTLIINYDNTEPTLVGDTIAIQIESNSSQNNFNPTGWIDNISVSASAPADPLLVASAPLSFNTNNAVEVLSIPVSNAGLTQDLNITAVTSVGTDSSNFSVDPGDLPLVISPSSSGSIPLIFTPNVTYQATYSATLEITSNDASSPTSITLNITNNPDPWIVASDTDLTNNGSPDTYSVTISNQGNAGTLNIGTVTAGSFDSYTVSNIVAPAPILPGESGVITFTFTPDVGIPGGYEFSLIIPSDDPATPSKEIFVNMLVSDPIIFVFDNPLDFGLLSNGAAPLNEIVTVYNDGGTEDLIIDGSTAITGASEFAITNTSFPITIPPGSSAEIEVTFTPGTALGRLNASLQVASNDSQNTMPVIPLTAFIKPEGTIVAQFDFDPNFVSQSTVDADDSTLADVVLSDLIDEAAGNGALNTANQGANNRNLATGVNENYLRFSANRESDAQTPLASGGNDESTWTTFSITPESGGGAIDFDGGTAIIDTYANTNLGTNTSADWTLYFSTDGGTSWTSLGTSAGASTNGGLSLPVSIGWDLSAIGNPASTVQFILDPVSTGATNGTVAERSVGFDNLIVSVGSVTPGVGSDFATWAGDFGIPNDPEYDANDNDGIPALVEYALALSPLASDSLGDTFNPATGLLSFAKGAEAVANGDVTYAIETSTDLGGSDPWTAVDELDLEEGSASDPASISYTLPTGLGKIFARLVVTIPAS